MGMHSIVGGLPAEAFHFSGQSSMDAWTLKDVLREHGWAKYDRWRSQETVLFLQRVRELVQAFPTWQHVAATGRPPTDERTLLVAMFVRQAFRAPFAKVEGLLHLLAGFFGLRKIPDANTLSQHNRGARFSTLLSRFNQFILEDLPVRECVVATDATGYGAKKRSWKDTDYGLRATEGWIKSHCAIEVPQMLYLSTVQTAGGVHESQKFADVWRELPVNVEPFRSLADTAYSGEECLQTALDHGATPLHHIRADAKHTKNPQDRYGALVNFRIQWPNRFENLVADRSLAEATFSATKEKFGDRIFCRSDQGKKNEVVTKEIAHNILTLTRRDFLVA